MMEQMKQLADRSDELAARNEQLATLVTDLQMNNFQVTRSLDRGAQRLDGQGHFTV